MAETSVGENDLAGVKVSAIVPTFNRYERLMRAIESIRRQTHKNIEIIVVDDKSDERRYASDPPDDVHWIRLSRSSREAVGHPSVGYVRNAGLEVATGDYVAFLDDDDEWMPEKTLAQLTALATGKCEASCSEALIGVGPYDQSAEYEIYHRGHYRAFCEKFFHRHYGGWNGQLPGVFDLELIRRHNFVVVSSMLVNRSLFEDIGRFKSLPLWSFADGGPEDWEAWKRLLARTDIAHVNEPLLYVDGDVPPQQSWLGDAAARYKRVLGRFRWKQSGEV